VTFEQLLVKYLYQNKSVSLQGFGTITLNSNVPDLDVISKNRQIPIEGASFVSSTKAQTDEEFVKFFSQQKGKIKPLAESDIESHLQLARQLMNIGKPYEVEGLGIFAMNKDGGMVLQTGHYSLPSTEAAVQPARLRERTEQQERQDAEEATSAMSSGARKALIGSGIVLLLLVIGWFIWSKMAGETAPPVQPVTNTGVASDTLGTVQDSVSTVISIQHPDDTIPVWKAYFRTFNGKERIEAMQRLYSRYDSAVQVETADSSSFRMYVLVKKPTADTALLLDSLSKVFQRSITLERQTP
jgi:hypothetical protein